MNKDIIDYVDNLSKITVDTAEALADNVMNHSMKFTQEVAGRLIIAQTIVNIGLVIWLVILTK